MPKQLKSKKEKSLKGVEIFAYGFDAAGFETPGEPVIITDIGKIQFVRLEYPMSLESADGVIIPQGIFEKVQKRPYAFPLEYTDVYVKESLLLDREKQVLNMLREGKWVCFLIGEIVDRVTQNQESIDTSGTDLCKKLLNIFLVRRHTIAGRPVFEVKANEFIKYMHHYGIAKTVLGLSDAERVDIRVIATAGGHYVGVEFYGKLFFLPFHTTRRDSFTVTSVVRTVTRAIFDYRQKRIVEIPDWVDEFQFTLEQELKPKINSFLEQANNLQNELQSWREYKAILTTAGDILKGKLIMILERFFQFKIDPIDEGREDAKIIGEDGSVLVIVEAKGTKKGIKREHINQVDSHRERNELPPSIPGVLFINNEMSVEGIDKRFETKVPKDQIKHAKKLNILIIRTIDLLFLMRHLENNSKRKDKLKKLLFSGGGWLRAGSKGYQILEGE